MKIEVLYVPDCPNHPRVIKTIKEALEEAGLLDEHIIEVKVTDSDHATALAFPGSPTVRINGEDVEASLPQIGSYGLMCRTYLVDGMRQGVPHRDWVYDAIRRAASFDCQSGC